jgi:hypothetical protein
MNVRAGGNAPACGRVAGLQNKTESRPGLPGQASREEIPEMAIEFYDVKKREKVQIDESDVTKTTYERQGKDGKTQVRYAFKAVNEGTKLTKFASKDDWDALDAPVE